VAVGDLSGVWDVFTSIKSPQLWAPVIEAFNYIDPYIDPLYTSIDIHRGTKRVTTAQTTTSEEPRKYIQHYHNKG
jgi:hypothetical protein